MLVNLTLHASLLTTYGHMVPSVRYAAEAIAMLGIGYTLIRWVARTVRELGDRKREETAVAGITEGVAAAAAQTLRERGIVTDAQLASMTPKERHLLLMVSEQRLGRKKASGPQVAVQRPTPVRPVGERLHCPSCGALLSREELMTFGHTRCPKCARRVTGHVQPGRLTVIVEETAEEAERRTQQ